MISILHNKSTCPGTLTDHVHKLISLISSKNVRVVSGPRACVDQNHTVYLPPLPDGATEKDFIKYFHLGTHEQSHIECGSDFKHISKDRIKAHLENALEDIRCEQLQEKSLPGLVPYRIRYYAGALEEFANKELSEASFNDIVKLIVTLGKYIIVYIRKIQLQADHLDIKASRDILYAYDKYVSDLEDRILNMTTTDQMYTLADIIYNRFKKIIRNQIIDNHSSNNSQGTNPLQGDNDDDSGEDQEKASSADSETDPKSGSDSDDSDDDGEQASGESPEEDSDPEDSGDAGGAGASSGDSSPEDDGSDGESSDIDPEEIEEELQRIIDELNSNNDAMDVVTDLKDQINSQGTRDLPYMVSPHVKDVIGVGPETTPENAVKIKEFGLKYLGPKGSQITKLFVCQSNTRTAYNQYKGMMDVVSIISDVHDSRDDVYREVTGPRLDKTAVTFLIDNSGSMKNNIGYIYAMLSGLLHYLSRAQIPTEAIGYTAENTNSGTWRDAPAHLTLIKQFSEQYNGAVMKRCIPPYVMDYTNDLDGLKFAVPRIWARPERKKVIMILCDGDPCLGTTELESKLKKSYKEYIELCRKAGLIVFGIGINKDLTEYFGKDDFASVNLDNAGGILIDRLTKILNRVRA